MGHGTAAGAELYLGGLAAKARGPGPGLGDIRRRAPRMAGLMPGCSQTTIFCRGGPACPPSNGDTRRCPLPFCSFSTATRDLCQSPSPVILRERSDRRISQVPGNTRSFATLRMTTWLLAEVSTRYENRIRPGANMPTGAAPGIPAAAVAGADPPPVAGDDVPEDKRRPGFRPELNPRPGRWSGNPSGPREAR